MKIQSDNIESTYDFLNFCNDRGARKGCIVCTDKQTVSYFDTDLYGYTHDDLSVSLESEIIPNDRVSGWGHIKPYHTHTFFVGKEIYINPPIDDSFSYPMYLQVCKILDEIERFIKENKNKYYYFSIISKNYNYTSDEEEEIDFSKIREKLKGIITNDLHLEQEKIIGKRLNKNEIEETIKNTIDFSKCTTIADLYHLITICNSMSNDDMYKDSFNNMFPGIKRIEQLIILGYNLNINETYTDLNNSNVFEKVVISNSKTKADNLSKAKRNVCIFFIFLFKLTIKNNNK